MTSSWQNTPKDVLYIQLVVPWIDTQYKRVSNFKQLGISSKCYIIFDIVRYSCDISFWNLSNAMII